MNKKMISIILFVLVGALVISAFSWVAITGFNESQRAGTGYLTSLNADEVSAYRWNAMARFYEKQVSQIAEAQNAIKYGPPGR